jgi:hypothetical protein
MAFDAEAGLANTRTWVGLPEAAFGLRGREALELLLAVIS